MRLTRINDDPVIGNDESTKDVFFFFFIQTVVWNCRCTTKIFLKKVQPHDAILSYIKTHTEKPDARKTKKKKKPVKIYN